MLPVANKARSRRENLFATFLGFLSATAPLSELNDLFGRFASPKLCPELGGSANILRAENRASQPMLTRYFGKLNLYTVVLFSRDVGKQASPRDTRKGQTFSANFSLQGGFSHKVALPDKIGRIAITLWRLQCKVMLKIPQVPPFGGWEGIRRSQQKGGSQD